MLKIGKVYLFENKYFYIADRRRFNGRNLYTVNKVNKNGTLGTVSKIRFKRDKWVLAPECTVFISVQFKRSIRNQRLFQELMSRCNDHLAEYSKSTDEVRKKYLLTWIGRNSMSVVGIKKADGSAYTLRDIADNLKTTNKKAYNIIANYLKATYRDDRYTESIPRTSDGVIRDAIRNYQDSWGYLYGYSEKINEVLIIELMAYTLEFHNRGLSLI